MRAIPWLVLLICTGPVRVGEGREMQLIGRQVTIGFDAEAGGIVSVIMAEDEHEFIRQESAERPLLWRLAARDTGGREAVVDNTQAPSPQIEEEEGTLSLRWERVDLPGDRGALRVRVQCVLNTRGDGALLRLWVENRSESYGLWSVQFPVIAPLSEAGTADVAIGRGNWGELHRGGTEKIAGEYPSHNLPMQFMLLHEGESGLYLGAHDPGARPKNFELTPGGEFHVNTWAEDMGVPGSDWAAPYPFELGVYRGDWMTGCKRYRAWALAEAPWTRKGPLAERDDVPAAMKEVCAWIVGQGTSEEAVPVVRRFAEAIGAPVGVHWYNWHQIPFDTRYPDYFPTKPGFAEGVAELKRAGVVVMPYINARLWDSGNDDFAAARPFSAKDEEGEPIIEEYGSGAKLAVMCPTQPFWQEKVAEIVRRLGEECGVNAVYLDQIASAPARRCFDPQHGHPIGSGRWWVDGYREMMAPIKAWCAEHGVGLTTENNAEPYMDNIEGLLIWTPRGQNEIPMTTAVYSGYTLYFASNRALAGGEASYCLCQARDFVWGTQLGWEGAEILAPENAAGLEFLGRLARLRARALDYLVHGELLELLQPQNEIPEITGRWSTWAGDREVTLPAVHAALWKGRDGSLAVLLANADTAPHEYTFVIDGDRHGLGEGQPRSRAVTVPARDGVMVVVE